MDVSIRGEETRRRKTIRHASAKRDGVAVRCEKVDDFADILQGSLLELLAPYRVSLRGEVGIDERVERDGEGCGVVIKRHAVLDRTIGRTSLSLALATIYCCSHNLPLRCSTSQCAPNLNRSERKSTVGRRTVS